MNLVQKVFDFYRKLIIWKMNHSRYQGLKNDNSNFWNSKIDLPNRYNKE